MDRAEPPITELDECGRKRDFHSLRHTTGSFFNGAGVNPKVAPAVLGHSDINLTMGIYTHTYRDDEAQAVAALLDLPSPSAAGSATSNRNRRHQLVTRLVTIGRGSAKSQEAAGVKQADAARQQALRNTEDNEENEANASRTIGRSRTCPSPVPYECSGRARPLSLPTTPQSSRSSQPELSLCAGAGRVRACGLLDDVYGPAVDRHQHRRSDEHAERGADDAG